MTELQNLDDRGLAIQGYDPVSYFSYHPMKGNSDLTSNYEGATYYFASPENKAKFDAEPAKYIPQYGGYCAIAVSEGKAFPIDPNIYRLTDGKLYLFYNGELGNNRPQWIADEENRRKNADAYWGKQNLVPG